MDTQQEIEKLRQAADTAVRLNQQVHDIYLDNLAHWHPPLAFPEAPPTPMSRIEQLRREIDTITTSKR